MSDVDAPIDVVLDGGASGLRYFADFLPRADQVRPHGIGYDKLCARYDEQRGLDLAALHSDADVLGRALSVLDDQLREQSDRVRALQTNWSGGAADTAREFLGRHLQRAQHDRDTLSAVHDAIVAATTALRDVVTEKADAVAAFPDRIDGKDAADVDRILHGAKVRSDGDSGDARAVTSVFPELTPLILAGSTLSPAVLGKISDRCTQWLNEVLVPHVDEYLQNFDELCTVTDNAVRDIYGRVVAAMAAVDDSPYPAPDSTAPASTDQPVQPQREQPSQVPGNSSVPAQPSVGYSTVPQQVPVTQYVGGGQSAPAQSAPAQSAPAPTAPAQAMPAPGAAASAPAVPASVPPMSGAPELDGAGAAPTSSTLPFGITPPTGDALVGLVGGIAHDLIGVANDAVTGIIGQFQPDAAGAGEMPDGGEMPGDAVPSGADPSGADPSGGQPPGGEPSGAAPAPGGQTPDGDHKTDPGKPDTEADFDIQGSHLHIEKQPDGDLTVEVTGPEKSFELSIDDHGVPVVTDPAAPVPPAADQAPADSNEPQAAPPEAPQPAAQQPAPAQPEAAAPQSDSAPQHEEQSAPAERTPQQSGAEPAMQLQPDRRDSHTAGRPQLASTRSDEPDDGSGGSGAILAEAGPL